VPEVMVDVLGHPILQHAMLSALSHGKMLFGNFYESIQYVQMVLFTIIF